MRRELEERIVNAAVAAGVQGRGFMDELTIILSDYDISRRETEMVIWAEDENVELLKRFIIAKTIKGLSPRTLKFYQKTVSNFLERVNKPARMITADDIRLHLAIRLKRDEASQVTVGNELRNLRSFFGWCHREGLIETDPCYRVDAIKLPKTKKEAFSEIEVELLRRYSRPGKEKAAVELMLSTGCRVSELVGIRIDDIKDDSIIVHGKGNKDRKVFLNAKAIIAVNEYLSMRKDTNPYLFPKGVFKFGSGYTTSPQKAYEESMKPENIMPNEPTDKSTIEHWMQRLGKRAGVKNCHPHRFRRTCATFALKRGMPILSVSKMLGHEQISTTQIYLDLSDEDLEADHKRYVV